MNSILIVFGLTLSAWVVPAEKPNKAVEPEYLDTLLREKRYHEFNKILGIEHHHLSLPQDHNNTHDPRYNKHLLQGDILLTPFQAEQARQGILFTNYPKMKWYPHVPFLISREFNFSSIQAIIRAINEFNWLADGCISWVPRQSYENDWVYIFPGEGCYSHLGKTGGVQPLSLQENGCISQGTVMHEMNHAIGFMHEQCRSDRDDYIQLLEENLNKDWLSQFEKVSEEEFGCQGDYDYESLMHYPKWHPDLCIGDGPAFKVLRKGVDESKIGYGNTFTDTDLEKIFAQYCE